MGMQGSSRRPGVESAPRSVLEIKDGRAKNCTEKAQCKTVMEMSEILQALQEEFCVPFYGKAIEAKSG